jgi:membrane-associated phospholipid phosphatase
MGRPAPDYSAAMTRPEVRSRRDGDLLADPRRGAVLAALLLLAVVVAATLVAIDRAVPPALFRLDTWWRGTIEPAAAWTARASEDLYRVGGGSVMVPFRVVVALVLVIRRRWYDLTAWLLSWVAADILTQALKPALGRLRPDGADTTSFPSGHAKTAAQASVGLVLIATSPWRSRAWAWTLAAAWIVPMALSRTVLVEHYLSDVVTGALLGAACTIGAAAIVQLRRDRRLSGRALSVNHRRHRELKLLGRLGRIR